MKVSILRQIIKDAWRGIKLKYLSSRRDKYGYIHPTATVLQPCACNKANTFLHEHSVISEDTRIINSTGKFILKRYSICAARLTAICQNHNFFDIGTYPGYPEWGTKEISGDVIVDDYVWIGANVTLCPGVHIGRGCLVAAGAVCVKSKKYPPYTVIGGNPAKVIKYRFTLEEQIKHEELVCPKEERLDIAYLTKCYEETMNTLHKK